MVRSGRQRRPGKADGWGLRPLMVLMHWGRESLPKLLVQNLYRPKKWDLCEDSVNSSRNWNNLAKLCLVGCILSRSYEPNGQSNVVHENTKFPHFLNGGDVSCWSSSSNEQTGKRDFPV